MVFSEEENMPFGELLKQFISHMVRSPPPAVAPREPSVPETQIGPAVLVLPIAPAVPTVERPQAPRRAPVEPIVAAPVEERALVPYVPVSFSSHLFIRIEAISSQLSFIYVLLSSTAFL